MVPESGWFGIRAACQTLVSAAAAIKLTTTAGETGPELQKQTSITVYYLWGGQQRSAAQRNKKMGKSFFFFRLLTETFAEDPACVQSACGQTNACRDEGGDLQLDSGRC